MDNNLGKIITKYRQDNKLTQKDLAKKLNITDKAISRWENGYSSPDLEMLGRLSKIFKIDHNILVKAKMLDGKDGEDALNDILDEFKEIKKKHALKIKIGITVFIVIFIIYTIAIIFTQTFNRFKVYDVTINSASIYQINGLYVETRIKDTLQLGTIKLKGYEIQDTDIVSADLYFTKNNKEYVLQSYSSLENINFVNNLSYVKIDNLSDYFDNLYLRITIIDENNKSHVYETELLFTLNFSNNKVFYKDIDSLDLAAQNINTDEVKDLLLANGFEEINTTNLVKRTKSYAINYIMMCNKIIYSYEKNKINYRYTYNLSTNILEVLVYDKNNTEIQNYEYDVVNEKMINCQTGSCNDYNEVMSILDKNVFCYFKTDNSILARIVDSR